MLIVKTIKINVNQIIKHDFIMNGQKTRKRRGENEDDDDKK